MFLTRHRRVVAGAYLISLGVLGLHAQTNQLAPDLNSTNAPATTTNTPACCLNEAPASRLFSLSGDVGSLGGGGSASWRFASHLGLRVGADYFPYDHTGKIEDVKYNSEIRLLSGAVSVDVHPWKKSSFRISVGALINESQLNGSPNPNEDVTIDGITFTPADVGTLRLKINPQIVSPFISVGGTFFYFDRARRWALGGELGVAYTKWDVDMTHSAPPNATLDDAIANERKRIKNNLNDFPIWPIVKLQLTYSF